MKSQDTLLTDYEAKYQAQQSSFKKSVVRDYIGWVTTAILLVFQSWVDGDSYLTVQRAAKRGDSRYRKQVNARMYPIFKAAESIQPFFNRKTRKVNSQTNCLYVTGTIPHNISLGAAWEREISYHFNLFMTRLRRKYHR